MSWTEEDFVRRCPTEVRRLCTEKKVDDRCLENARGCGRYWQILKKMREKEAQIEFYKKYPIQPCPRGQECPEYSSNQRCGDPWGSYLGCLTFWKAPSKQPKG